MVTEEAATLRRTRHPRHRGYRWIEVPDRMMCLKDGTTQTLRPKLWEAEAATEAHNDLLMSVTIEVNEILEEVAKNPPQPHLELSLILFQSRYMLAWTSPMRGLTPDDDPIEIAKAFRLRRDDPDYPVSEEEE